MNRSILYVLFVVLPALGTLFLVLSLGGGERYSPLFLGLFTLVAVLSPPLIYKFSSYLVERFKAIVGLQALELYFLMMTLALISLFINGSILILRNFTKEVALPLVLLLYEIVIGFYYARKFKVE